MGKNIDKNDDIEMIFGNKVIIAGVDPNLNPATRRDNAGRSVKQTTVSGSMGNVEIEKPQAVLTECDNSSDRIGGNVNIVGMNGVKIEAGSGGIDLISAGNITMMPGGGICNVAATESFGCISKNISIASTEGTNIAGGNLSVESQASSFANNVAMNGNAKINGGCFINGEAFIPHMTTQRQENYTEACGECSGFINPLQTFVLLPGDRTLVQAAVGGPDGIYLPLEFDTESIVAFVVRVVQMVLKGGAITDPSIPLPVKPMLVHILSKGMLNQLGMIVPSLKVVLIKEHPELAKGFALLDSEADFNIPGHRHKFIGPACSYTDSTADLYEEAKAVEDGSLVKHKPCEANGGKGAFDKMIEEDKEAAKNWFKAWFKRIGKYIAKSIWD